MEALGPDGDFGCGAFGLLVEHGGVRIEGGAGKDQPLRGLVLGFGIGGWRVLSAFVSLPGLLLVGLFVLYVLTMAIIRPDLVGDAGRAVSSTTAAGCHAAWINSQSCPAS